MSMFISFYFFAYFPLFVLPIFGHKFHLQCVQQHQAYVISDVKMKQQWQLFTNRFYRFYELAQSEISTYSALSEIKLKWPLGNFS